MFHRVGTISDCRSELLSFTLATCVVLAYFKILTGIIAYKVVKKGGSDWGVNDVGGNFIL